MTGLRFDLPAITHALFHTPGVAEAIARDYQLSAPGSAEELVHGVVAALQQPQSADPRNEQRDAHAVFAAAVNALGSNSRTWATFLTRRDTVMDLLGGGDPTAATAQDPTQLAAAVRAVLGGQRGRTDARAMVTWAALLTEHPDWSTQLTQIAATFDDLAAGSGVGPLTVPELTACLAGYLAEPRPTWPGETHPRTRALTMPPTRRKLPGMGFPLGSEFLRNLGWAGFKPDRHIVRLLCAWAPATVTAQQARAHQLAALIGRPGDTALRHNLQYALAGAALTPDGNYSRADNLVWLLGAYVERRGKQTATVYLTENT